MMLSTKRPCAPCSGTGRAGYGMTCQFCFGAGIVDLKETTVHLQTFMVRKYMTWPVVRRTKSAWPVVVPRPNGISVGDAFAHIFCQYENALETLATLE